MKNFLHKSLSFVLVITLALGLFSGLSFQSSALSSSGKCGENVAYTYSSGNLVISGSGAMYNYSYGKSPFHSSGSIINIVIENGVTSIGQSAFYACSELESITIPNSVVSIGHYAFNFCRRLNAITIPDSVKSIGVRAFDGCTSLTSVNIPNSITIIEGATFEGCSRLTSVTIPNSVTIIEEDAFKGCSGLKELTLPCSVHILGEYTFENCMKIEKIKLTKGTGTMRDYDISTKRITPWEISCNSLKSLVLEDGITNIGSYAFNNCSVLTSITIPDSVTSIGHSAFMYCSGLTSITLPDSVTSIGFSAFYNTAYYKDSTNWNNNVLYIGNHLIIAKENLLGAYTIKPEIKTIADCAFQGCSGLTSVDIKGSNCSIYDSEDTIPVNATIIINGSKNVYDYVVKYNRNFVCNHVEEIDSAEEPTCTETGLTEGSHCSICQKVLVKQQIVSALRHDYADTTVTAPTPDSLGYTTYTCTHCGDSYRSSYTSPTGIVGSFFCESNTESSISFTWDDVNAATGYQAQISDFEGSKWANYQNLDKAKVTFDDLTPNHEYKFRVRFYIKGSDGKNYYSPWSSIATFATSDHTYRSKLTAPSCTIAGFTTYTCFNCGHTYVNNYTEPLGHDLRVVETIAPTYTEQGYDILKCQRAGCDYFCHGNFVPSTLETISVSLQSPITLLERADARCYERTDLAAMQQYGEFYYEYSYSIFKHGNAITLTSTSGEKDVFIYSEDAGAFVNAADECIYPEVTDTQSEITPWTVGTNYFTVSYGDKSVNVPVTIRKNPIVQIVFTPNNPYIYTQYAEGDWDTYQASEFDAPVRYFRYDLPNFNTGDRLAVSYDDGVLHYNTDYTYDETKKAFVSATGESISGSEVKCGYRGGNCLDWTIGERGGWFEFTYLGCTTYAGVKIRENYVQSIAFTSLKPYEVIEGNSKEHFKKWDEKTETYIEGDYYDAFDIYVPGNQLTVTYKNGSSDTFICKQTSEGLVFANAAGEEITPKSVSNQYQKPWTLGSDNSFTVKWSGVAISVPVTMVESPISDIAYNPAKPVVLVENTGGYYRDNDWYHDKVFFYDNPLFKEGDEIVLYFKTGSTKKYTAKVVNGKVDFYDSVGNLLEGILWVDDNYQYENPWHLGNYNACIINYMGQSASIPVSVVKNHTYVTSVIKQPTCTSKGVTQYVCTDCGDTYLETIPMIPHTYASAIKENEVAATCTAAGSYEEVIYCAECKIELSRTIKSVAALGHDYLEIVTKPTTTTLGYTVHTCSRCDDNYLDTYTAPTGKLPLKCKARTAAAQTVKWNNVKAATGYQVQISTKDGKNWSTYATLKAGTTAYTFKSLAAGNTYKFRVRFYIKAADDKNYFSPWSTTLNFPTLPSGTTLTKLTPAKKAFIAQWKQNKTVNGYQVQYSLKSNFSGAKTVTFKSNKTLKTTVKKLSAKKVYYVRIRTYKTISNVNYFSTWSKPVKVKTK